MPSGDGGGSDAADAGDAGHEVDGLATKLVFVTSTTYNAALGGLAGADAKCQMVADAAMRLGTFKAWLSDATTSATSRLAHSTIPYALLDGTIVAADFDALAAVPHAHELNQDEHGVLSTSHAWTGSRFNGLPEPNASCSSWTTAAATPTAVVGSPAGKDFTWTEDFLDECNTLHSLYCLQQ
jgi:hypothetical protein